MTVRQDRAAGFSGAPIPDPCHALNGSGHQPGSIGAEGSVEAIDSSREQIRGELTTRFDFPDTDLRSNVPKVGVGSRCVRIGCLLLFIHRAIGVDSTAKVGTEQDQGGGGRDMYWKRGRLAASLIPPLH